MAEKTEVFRIKVEGTQDVLRLEQELKKLKAEARKTTDKTVFTQLTEEIVKTQAALKDARREQNQAINEVLAADKGVGAYKRLSAQLNATKKELKDLAADGRANTQQFREQMLAAQKLDRQLKMIDASVGEFGRNVGNYAGSLKGFFGSLKAQIQASGFIGRGGIQMFATQLFNGVKKLLDIVDQYNTTFSQTAQISKKVEAATDDVVKSYISERKELDTLTVALLNSNTKTDEKQQIIATLNQKYPEYFGNLDAENLKVEDVEKAYRGANSELLKNLKQKTIATILEQQLIEATQKGIEAEKERSKSDALRLAGARDLTAALVEANAQYSESSARVAKGAAGDVQLVNSIVDSLFNDLGKQLGDFEAAFGSTSEYTAQAAQQSAAAQKKAQEQTRAEYKKTLEAAEKARQEYLQSEIEFQKQQIQSALSLQNELKQAIVDNIADEGERAIAQEKLNYEMLKAQRAAQFADIVARAEKQEEELLKVYKDGSSEVIAFRTTVSAQIAELESQFAALSEQDEKAHQNRLTAIQKEGQGERTEETQDWVAQQLALDAQYTAEIEANAARLVQDIDEQLAEGEIKLAESERRKFQIRKKAIEDQLNIVDAQLSMELNLTDQQRSELTAKQSQLYDDLKANDRQYTEFVREQSEQQKQARQKTIEDVLGYVSQGIDAIGELLNAANDAETNRLDEQIETRQKNIDNLEKQLDAASGLQKAFLQKQIDEETRQAEQLAKQKADIEKKAAKRNKAMGIIQAIINTALGVSQALASLPPPASFITAAITGALGAVQIATIAAQPLARGGYTGSGAGKPDKTGYKPAGIVHEGEWVAPKWMVQSKSFSPVIKSLENSRVRRLAIGGFASGGLTSSPQRLQSAISTENADLSAVINSLDAKTDAINSRIDRIEIVHTNRTQESIDKDKKEVQTIRQLNKLIP